MPAPAAEMSTPIKVDGHHLGELHVPAGTDRVLLSRALRQLTLPAEWAQLGAKLVALGPYRITIATRAATAAAGGRAVTAEEEERIALWFGAIVDEAIQRGGLPAAVAIWTLLVGDSHVCSAAGRAARCPAMATVPPPPPQLVFEPGESSSNGPPDPEAVRGFLSGLRTAAPKYIHTAVACASEAALRDLRAITAADVRALEEFRPWGADLGADGIALEALEDARSMLTYRHLSNAEACNGFADWAHGFAGMVAEHALSPVLRVGAITWLARVALRGEGGDLSAGSPSAALTSDAAEAVETAAAPDRAPYVGWMASQALALNAAGWKVIEVHPSTATPLVLWRVTIERYDQELTMTLRDARDPEVALEELLRYVQVDAR